MVGLIVIAALLVVFAAVLLWGAWENAAVRLHALEVRDEKLPSAFDGFTIAHVSDLHNAQFGEDQAKLVALLKEAKADVIAVTGDVIDKRRPGTEHALDFFERAVRIAPVYYVTGNHEAVSAEYPALREKLEQMGVHILADTAVTLTREGDTVTLAGVDDPLFAQSSKKNEDVMREKLAAVLPEKRQYTVLLTHRPELFAVYRAAGVDLALAGHAHGGQFRLPWGQGVIAPNQGLFPKYTQGVYTEAGGKMSVSRGLGNSSVPIRLCNRPEVVALTLKKGE